ncbi:MAG: hypothetical protein ACPGUC_05790 [Gammaproteobacteria bacterium]
MAHGHLLRIVLLALSAMTLAAPALAGTDPIYAGLSPDEQKLVDAVKAKKWPLTDECSEGYGAVSGRVVEEAERLYESGVIKTHHWSAATGAAPYFQAHCDELGVAPTDFGDY